ncbi:CaiF/GrlA family transcriptional regulator [Salmonella enterica subsp. enterica serovar Enteritidis]|nr:CaiF/GrlA family transcriptional regulator [Salmonella enterica subsp. enterica serovar Newport]EBS5765064.1 CaiF/GrlA family transcriptional regulator [Salmonella enterica subsp. enterica serovar Enteritidis]ECG6590301.1 CaiF/GrlA family transcriptional regulator [Salmonella enterica subsp. enterica serovar Newport]EGU1063047.1 CaiF/GrlA family transcriptional regulator [Salmonella enterica subsp. enterica serovar Enteritidis]EHF2785296.1 CaiF/GrlA family transcriptional regulator [Salmonel
MCPDKIKKQQYILPDNDIHYPNQTNHDACFIPENVRQYAGEPLYILVAHWCIQQQSWVHRNQISEAFHITPRRASYLVSYLRNKTSRIDCICRHQSLANKARRYEIFVIRILDPPETDRRRRPVSPPVSRRRMRNANTAQANELWNQLCSNRPEGVLKKEDEDGNM